MLATKIAASGSFLATGLLNYEGSSFAIMVVAALAFSWVGDVLLVWRTKAVLLGGIAAFLVAHVAYAVAFAALPLDAASFGIALIIWNVVAVLLLRWLWQYLDGYYRIAVLVYMSAITIMVSLAAATTQPILVAAATLFAVSDISVARDRFIERSVTNKIWGKPLYYLAQVMFAISIALPHQ